MSLLGISVFFKADIQSDYNLPPYAMSVFATDIYHDGFNDILVGHETGWAQTNPTLTLMKNAYGTFTIFDTSKVFAGIQNNIFAVDVNNDGWNDIVASHLDGSSGNPTHYLRIYYNDNGTFPNNNYIDFNLNTSANIDGVSFGDINGDGHIDLLVFSHNSGFWGILFNDGYGNFSSPTYYYLPPPINTLSCGDLNGDGRDDVVVCGENTTVYYSYPSGLQPVIIDSNVFMQYVSIVDFNLDGKKDILNEVYVWSGNYTILRMFKNLGSNSFQKLQDIVFQGSIGDLLVNEYTDFNNDNYPDLLFYNIGGIIIWYNQGNFQIADSQYVAIPNYGNDFKMAVYCKDLDNNGFNDIITSQWPENQNYFSFIDILFNDGNGNFVPNPIVGTQNHNPIHSSNLQNYPNPFEDVTVFNFDLKETSIAELSVFDLQGSLLHVLSIKNWKEELTQ